MALGTFTLTIDADRLGGDPETTAKVLIRPQNGDFIKDPAAGKFHLKATEKTVALPWTIDLETDVATGGDYTTATIGYIVSVRTDDNARISSTFAARPDGATVNLVDLTESVVIPVADSVAAADRAEAAATDAETAAAAAQAVGNTNDTIISGRINDPTSQTAAALSASIDQRVPTLATPKWKANTAYAAGAVVIAPDGSTVTANAAFTSGAAYSSANWTSVAAKTGTQAKTELDAIYATPQDIGRAPVNNRYWPALTIMHNMAAGVSTNSGTVAINNADTSDPVMGTTAVTVTSNASGGANAIWFDVPTTNMTGRGLLIWMKISDQPISAVQQIIFEVISDATGNTNRYRWTLRPGDNKHAIKGMEGGSAGVWWPIQIPYAALIQQPGGTPDITSIKRIGILPYFTNGTTAHYSIGGIASYNDTSTAWPNGVCTFTFDEGNALTNLYAVKVLAAKGWAGTAFPVSTGTSPTTTELQKAQDTYGWEIGVHASSSANHVDYAAQTTTWIETEQLALRRWQNANSIRSSSFAYPLGTFSSAAAQIIAKHYEAGRATGDYVNSPNPLTPSKLGSFPLRTPGLDLPTMKAAIDQAAAGKGWVIVTVHDLVTASPSGNQWLQSDFQALVDYVAASGLAVARMKDVLHPKV